MSDADELEREPGSDEAETPQESPQQLMYGVAIHEYLSQRSLHPSRDGYMKLIGDLHGDGYLMCIDLTAVDYLTHPGRVDLPAGIAPERFELVVNLINHGTRERIRVRVQVPESDPIMPSLFDLYPGTEAMEREVFDLFGISFTGHPDLTRIMMPDDWVGHPLRKDYDSGRIPVQFKNTGNR